MPGLNSPDSQNALHVPQAPSRQSSGMLIRWRYDASATVWSSRQVMNRVTPSSHASATWWPATSMSLTVMAPRSEVVDVDHVVDVVVLQHHRLAADERRLSREVDRVEGRAVVRVDRPVTEVHRVPVESHVDDVTAPLDHLDVAEVVARARLRDRGRRAALGADPEDAVLQATLVGVVDERDVALRVLDEHVVVGPGRHPVDAVVRVAVEPRLELPVVEEASLPVEE